MSRPNSTPINLLNGSYSKYADKLDPDILLRLDGLYGYYHRQDISQVIHSSPCLLARRDNGGDERSKWVVSFHISRLLPNDCTKIENYTRLIGANKVNYSREFWVLVCKRYKRMGLMESQAVTADVQPRGKYETTKTSASLPAEHSERSQSKETSRNVNPCQRRSDQCCQRDGS